MPPGRSHSHWQTSCQWHTVRHATRRQSLNAGWHCWLVQQRSSRASAGFLLTHVAVLEFLAAAARAGIVAADPFLAVANRLDLLFACRVDRSSAVLLCCAARWQRWADFFVNRGVSFEPPNRRSLRRAVPCGRSGRSRARRPLPHQLEGPHAFALVLDLGIDLGVAAQADARPQMVHRQQVVFPGGVEEFAARANRSMRRISGRKRSSTADREPLSSHLARDRARRARPAESIACSSVLGPLGQIGQVALHRRRGVPARQTPRRRIFRATRRCSFDMGSLRIGLLTCGYVRSAKRGFRRAAGFSGLRDPESTSNRSRAQATSRSRS